MSAFLHLKKHRIPFTALLIFSMLACEPAPGKKEASPPGKLDPISTYTSADGHTIGMNVELNDGAKWTADRETTRIIAVMQGMLGEFPKNPTIEDYRELHKKLLTQFQSLLQKCTMTGEAHEQLHNYLMPLKAMIDKLEKGNLDACNTILPDMKDYLMKYSHFFF
jgi:hypothetical protein